MNSSTPETTVSPPSTQLTNYHPGRRPDIEGLRAVAVLAVLGYHAVVPFFGGGYVGVDVFFVVSGFLITGLLLADVVERGRFSLAEFYARRARRILPSAGVTLVAVAVASWLLLPPLRAKDVAYDVLASALNVGNWRFVANQTDYLAAQRDPSPVLHFWSLAVEEQFYLVWAPLLLGLALLARWLRGRPIPVIAVVLGLLTFGSFALSLYWTRTSAPLAYLGSPSRAWQFGVGGLAALVAPALRKVHPRWVLGIAGAVAVLWSIVRFNAATPFPGTAALLPTLGTAAIILAADPTRTPGVSWLLARRPMRAIGRLSFAWYLWHWPVLVLAQAHWGPLPWPVTAGLVVASAVPAYLTMRLVERPLRFSAVVSALPKRGLAIGATAVMLPLAAGLLLGSGAQRTMTAGEVSGVASAVPLGAAEGPNLLAGPVNRPDRQVIPSTDQARTDYPPVAGCELAPAALSGPACVFGDTSSPDRVLLLGDSHASQWFAAVDYFAQRRHWAVRVLVKQGCPLARLTVTSPVLGRTYTECDTWRAHTLAAIANGPKPKLILVSSLNHYAADYATVRAGWDSTLQPLATVGVPIVYLQDTPMPGTDVPVCVSGQLLNWSACAFPRSTALQPDPFADEITRHQRPGAYLVSVNDLLCPAQQCPAVLEGILLYRDDSHLTNTAVVVLRNRVEKSLTDQGLIPVVP